jgi:hypothetical protein
LVRSAIVCFQSRRRVGVDPVAAERPQDLLEFRIDGHMRTVRRALDQIEELNPKGTPREELPEEVWDSLAWRGDRSLIDIVDAEVRFWTALIEDNPMIRLGEDEGRWVARVVRLADIIRESKERRRRDLVFLRDRLSRL